jgi:hypothetical protein
LFSLENDLNFDEISGKFDRKKFDLEAEVQNELRRGVG